MPLPYKNDSRIVLTLDAGGTNFVFSAIQAGEMVVSPIALPSNGQDLKKCLQTITAGFETVKERLTEKPIAISFAFPGPADYHHGIIGDLGNLPGFRGGVPLAPILKSHFQLPVFINNDGDLFAYGEARGGMLPEINQELERAGSSRRYQNLIGITLGTGFGAGVVTNNQLLLGDNSMSTEVWLLSNRHLANSNAEEGVSTRVIISTYQYLSGENKTGLMPVDIFQIAQGKMPGDALAAKKAFEQFGSALGDSLANLITLFDGLVVIGGGLTGAQTLYMPSVMREFENHFTAPKGQTVERLVQKVFDYNQPEQRTAFLKSYSKELFFEGMEHPVAYDPVPRTAITHSKLGASKAISLGAYLYALEKVST
ncbi:MAG TPA: hypothetical protein DCQ26_09000 [Marinilabiliales bacterium]|jgi:glucokinase|nr:MAG: hypothetical protein A2W95_11315 [Bacteroidetes bacterium GWA2_40_14]OFX63204.1 MAG: hypothetical protein A2W84_11175 [Bacteroidetes bacterium GWC2_40_13]OFX73294.1 MAG: hypothetical protein A2W96_02875 [Bacteroidetes bacterium GWD2_40_43]OFX88649.1 MAG: hypothetical protein A2W97_06850 [Bacteroidetes bacterium GWE2_40_63]OFY22703.1 MAG: hypothetical protein A2W88_11630 [Bacteroidetes bacterium GWF2_40_13]OFZ24084.1 MAG: hypothetical protein A2437_10910 [Bacteroidetes bacterium RIFOXYC